MTELYDNIKLKLVITIITIFLMLFVSTNTYSLQSIENLAYVVALGLDTSDNNNLKLSIQLAKPSEISTSSTTSSSEQSSSTVINSVECSSIQEGLNLFDSHISRTINLSHCKIIAFSEELALEDISEYLKDLSNNIQVSSHANVVISKCDASTFLEMTNPTLENFSARYYQIISSSSTSTSFTRDITIMDFFSAYNNSFQEPVAILSGINNNTTHYTKSNDSFVNKDNSYVAGQTPFNSKNNVENMGLAIFKGGKIVGELNGIETICHMLVSGNLKYCNIQIENPNNSSETLDLKIKFNKPTKTIVKIVGGSPYIDISLNITAQITSTSYDVDNLEPAINKYLKELIYNYLYKISKNYNADIDGFGKYALKNFTTINDWETYNWLNNYKNSFFKVNIKSNVESNTNFLSG